MRFCDQRVVRLTKRGQQVSRANFCQLAATKSFEMGSNVSFNVHRSPVVEFTDCVQYVCCGRGGERQIGFTCYIVPTWCSTAENAIGMYQAPSGSPQTASADLSTKGRYPILTPHLHWNPTGFSRSLARAPANDRRSPVCVLDPEADSAFHQGGERLIKNSCHSPTERLHGFGVHMIQTSRNTYGLASDSPGRAFFTSSTHSPNVSANTVHSRKRSPCWSRAPSVAPSRLRSLISDLVTSRHYTHF